MVTLNALAAADSVIIPVQAQYLPAKGMTQLMQTIGKVRQYINPSLRIDGILLNIVDNRTNLAKSTADALRKNFGSVIKIYRSSIPMAVKAAEVASKGVSIYKYEPSSMAITDIHYMLSDTKYPVTFGYAGQDTAVVKIAANDGKAIENDLIYGSVSGKKVDENGSALGGALIGLFHTDDGEFTKENALLTATSAEDGGFSFENIPYGTWYVREIEQPTGFVLDDTIYPVTIGADGQIVEIKIVSKYVRGSIHLTKVDSEYPDNKLTGATFEVYKDSNANGKLDDGDELLGTLTEKEKGEYSIYRFVTEETFDAYLYQLVEGKQKFASQIMTSKSPVRSCEDIDETALSYAEIKMLATGNPHIKEKMDLDIQVQKLRLLKSSFLSEKYALEDKIIKFYPQEIARRSDVIAGLKSDIERVAEHPKPSDETFVGMTVKGAFYSEKAEAGNAILEACKAMTNPDPIPLGEYRGFTMELYFEAREYKVRLKGELGYPVTLGTDTFGNITRLDNALEGLPKRLEMNEMELDNIKKQFKTAKVDVERPFPQEEELKTKTDRLNELNALLNVDKRENEIVGGEPDEGEEPPEKKPRDLER